MNGGISPREGEHSARHSHHERQSFALKAPVVSECSKYLGRIVVPAQVEEWDDDGEEAHDVQDQHESLKLGKPGAGDRVDEHCKRQDGPEEQYRLPCRRDIGAVVQDHEALNLGGAQVASRCECSQPADDDQPPWRASPSTSHDKEL